jgi:ribosome biogenesis GTPase A
MERVPVVLVVTGLEGKNDMDEWWLQNEKTIQTMKMSFDGHACITSWKGRDDMYEKKYTESVEKLWILVLEHCGPKHNVIVFGESGCGKSSLINMIVGKDVARVSNSSVVAHLRTTPTTHSSTTNSSSFMIRLVSTKANRAVFLIGRQFENFTP